VHSFVRSRVEGDVGVAEWPPETAFDDAPVRRWVFQVPELPDRMRPLLHATPGISCFVPAGTGVAVEAGYRHPVELKACPVFEASGLVLLRGKGLEPWVMAKLPAMGALAAFARVEMRTTGPDASAAVRAGTAETVRVPLRVTPSSAAWRNVTATWIEPAQMPLLRRLAYALPRATVAQTMVALTSRGAFLRSPAGIEAIPLGTFFVEIHPNLYVPAGQEVVPAVAPDVLARALGAPPGQVLFLNGNAGVVSVEEAAFAPLEAALLEAPPWEPAVAEELTHILDETPLELRVGSIGMLPTRGVEPPTT
jgi:FtsH ternary system domain X7